MTAKAPAPPQPPREGPFGSTDARNVALIVEAGRQTIRLEAWCRVGVWTTLQRLRPHEFVIRQSWGRLGERRPRLLAQVSDQAQSGVRARLRPEVDGSLTFHVEVAQAKVRPGITVGIFHGQRVALPRPRRHGYLFSGRAPPGWSGPVAAWSDNVRVFVGERNDVPPPEGALRFARDGEEGFVAGTRAESFVEEWVFGDPIHIDAEGVERMDYRLVKKRRAAGFVPGGSYGGDAR